MTDEHVLSSIPPLPRDGENARRAQALKVRKLFEGQWKDLLDVQMGAMFDDVRNKATGKRDLSTNILKTAVWQLAKLYPEAPFIHPPEGSTEDDIAAAVKATQDARWWSMATRNQRNVLGMGECFVRPSWKRSNDGMMYRIVTPDMVSASSSPDEPDLPDYVVEARTRVVDGERAWTWDVVDLRDPNNPMFAIQLAEEYHGAEQGAPLTEMFIPGGLPSGYPEQWIDSVGVPVSPYVLYHKSTTGMLFDGFENLELIDGTLTIAALWSFWLHCVRDASWPQRWAMNAIIGGMEVDTINGVKGTSKQVTTDPASLVMLYEGPGQIAPSVGQWSPGSDPATLGEAIAKFEARMGVHFNIGADDFHRSGSAESGYAISMKRAAVREAQKSFVPEFSRSDAQLMRVTSVILNNATGAGVPEEGYSLTYPGLPTSPQETKEALEEHDMKLSRGLESPVDAYMDLNPGTTREQALAALVRVTEENRQLALAGWTGGAAPTK
jgi:hypothetical protein